MKIAIMSDTHKKTSMMSDALTLLKNKGAQYLIHAGDLVLKENLEVLKNSGLIYTSVFGNNDYNLIKYQDEYNINQEPYYFKIKDSTFKLMHIPTFMTSDSNVIIYGHTHDFTHEYKNDTLFLNPGEICARNKPLSQCVLLEINKEEYIIDYYFKEVLHNDIWQNIQYKYKR